MKIKQEIWADAEGNPVPYGDERGKTVLFGVGATATEAQVKQYGLADGALVVLAPEADAAAAKAPKKPAEAPAQTTATAPASAPASSTSTTTATTKPA